MKMVKSDYGIEEKHRDLPLLSNHMLNGLVVSDLVKFLTFSLQDLMTEQ
jgi:hypothetical protein